MNTPELDAILSMRRAIVRFADAVAEAGKSIEVVTAKFGMIVQEEPGNRHERRQRTSSRYATAARHGSAGQRALCEERRGWA